MTSYINKVVFLLIVSSVLAGCDTKPSNEDLLAATIKQYEYLPGVSVASIVRTNGEKISENKYDVYWEASLKFQMSSEQMKSILKDKERGGGNDIERIRSSLAGTQLWALGNLCPQIRNSPGECVVKESGSFRKTENGWRMN